MKNIRHIFALDLRSLALSRVLLGLLCLLDIANRICQINTFYSDQGILPRYILINSFEIPWKMTLLNLNGSSFFVLTIALFGIFTSLMMIFGWRTKCTIFLTWIIVLSFQNRFPDSNHGGDNLLRLLLLWMIFLPVNARYSFDKILSEEKNSYAEFSGFGSFAWIAQLLFVYLFTFGYKLEAQSDETSKLIYYAMNLDMFTTKLGSYLLNWPKLMSFLSFSTLWLEGLGPLLLLIPWRQSLWRSFAVLAFLLLHVGIWLTLDLGTFPMACLILWIPFIPGSFWELKIFNVEKANELKLYYDPDCGFCRKATHLVKEFLFLPNLEIYSGQSDEEILDEIKTKKTWVLISQNKKFIRSKAMLELLVNSRFILLRFLGHLLYLLPLDFLYNSISSKRKMLGICMNQINYEKIILTEKTMTKFFLSLLLLLSLAWNVEGFTKLNYFTINSPFDEMVFSLGLNQQWNMFAPTPMKEDGWFVSEAFFEDGIVWDVFNDRPFTFDKPVDVKSTYPSSQWRKFLTNMRFEENETYKQLLANYFCRKWNEKSTKEKNKILRFNFYFLKEMTPLPGEVLTKPEALLFFNQQCV